MNIAEPLEKELQFPVNDMIGQVDFLFITLDTLRYDCAQAAWSQGQLKTLSPYLGNNGWECRHTPASFTYAAHHAFFSGFLPTPTEPGLHPRNFVSKFTGSQTTSEDSFVFEEPTIPEALSNRGYRTICIRGTGFFNPESALGRVLPELFDESHWTPELGVANRQSEVNQIRVAKDRLENATNQLTFLFINIAAIHQPNWFYGAADSEWDTLESHTAALVAVDQELGDLFDFYKKRKQDTEREAFVILCSDHGTAYGEDGHYGHRVAHDVVWKVPYAEFVL